MDFRTHAYFTNSLYEVTDSVGLDKIEKTITSNEGSSSFDTG